MPKQHLTILSIFHTHILAVVFALLISVIYGLPMVIFPLSLGGDYQGVAMLRTANEESYLGRIHDIVDGHGTLGSPFLFEYKDQPPLAPPTGEWLYALPALIFGVSLVTVLAVSKFVLPAVLFLLVYILILRLTGDGGWHAKLNAVAGGLFVVLGYDLVDYRTVLSYLSGTDSPGSFLLWARPVNPILGALFLFSFLLCVVAILRKTPRLKGAVLGGAIFLAFMFSSYFFSWGMALSILAMLVLFLLIRKEYKTMGTLALIVPLGILFATPYWVGVWRASQSPWYEVSVLRNGLFLTHYPILNKFLIATLLFFLLTITVDFLLKKKKGIAVFAEPWHLLTLAFLLGGFWAYSQQIVTGRTIWPYHFVQYTIPLSLVVISVLLFRVIREHSKIFWAGLVSVIILSSLSFGLYTQVSAYRQAHPYFEGLQHYGALFSWLNSREKDCVVFVNEDRPEMVMLNTIIPAYTHCNRYVSRELYSLIPEERALDSYLVTLRLWGISPDRIEEYLRANQSEATGYLYSNWKGLFGVKDFPDFSDPLLERRLREFPEQYKAFMRKDFKKELKKYRLDYILSIGAITPSTLKQLPDTKLIQMAGDMYLYSFR
ncbi:MAG: hypothetical protein Q7R93_02550 [bacterium]|nr:hypothetical protein [bacterium]